jgi:chorismate--pyruvate lyase
MLALTARRRWHNARFVRGCPVRVYPHDPLCRVLRQRGWLAHAFQTPRALRDALTDRGSLTRRLKARYADFRVLPVARGLAPAFPDERPALRLAPKTRAYVREVVLSGGGHACVFAHSVLPRASLRGSWHGLTRLGSRSLGEALFANPRIRRLGLTLRRIDARHPLHQAARRHTGTPARHLWARRSMFCLDGRPLLVTEVFLPEPPA